MAEGRFKLDPGIVAAIIGVLAIIVGAGLIFWMEQESESASTEGRIPWIEKWLNSREKRTDDSIRRIEKIESVLMESPKK